MEAAVNKDRPLSDFVQGIHSTLRTQQPRPPSVRWPPLPRAHSAGSKRGLYSTPSWRAYSRRTT